MQLDATRKISFNWFRFILVVVAFLAAALDSTAQTNQSITLAWNPSPDVNVAGYNLHYGVTSGSYTNTVNVGNQTNTTIGGLVPGQIYYIVVAAYNNSGLESLPSNEVSYQAPTNPAPGITLTAPVDGTTAVAPASLKLTASVTANGHAISAVQFYNGATLLGQATTAPYTFTWTNVVAGSYSVAATVIYDTNSVLSSTVAVISVTNAPITQTNTPTLSLPLPWQAVDIGSQPVSIGTDLNGSLTLTGGVYTLQSAGYFIGTTDNFRFVYQPMNGNGEILARLNSVTTANCAGVMIRENLSSNAKFAVAGFSSSSSTFRWRYRTVTGGNTSGSLVTGASLPNVWVRLVRTGDTFNSYTSSDGNTWTLMNSMTNSMASNIYIGFAIGTGNPTNAATATFDNVSVTP